MEANQIRRIPVIDRNGTLVGIIAQADIATRVRSAKKPAEVVEEISRPSGTNFSSAQRWSASSSAATP
jgi:CBS domain-containing protein